MCFSMLYLQEILWPSEELHCHSEDPNQRHLVSKQTGPRLFGIHYQPESKQNNDIKQNFFHSKLAFFNSIWHLKIVERSSSITQTAHVLLMFTCFHCKTLQSIFEYNVNNIWCQYNFRAEQRVFSNLIGWAVPDMTLYKPLRAVYITFWRPGY